MNVLKKPTLLLNMTYEPIGVITVEKAIVLEIKDRIYVEEFRDGFIKSPKSSWKIPSVIRLKKYINITEKKKTSAKKRSKIYIRDNHRCSYCNKKCRYEELTLDHVIPKSRGGWDTHENLVTACLTCNQKKGNRTPYEAGMDLLHTPLKLRVGLDKHELIHYAELNPQWKTYLFLSSDGDKSHHGE